MKTAITLRAEEVQKTIERLYLRISDRFPSSGLAGVCHTLHEYSRETPEITRWISRPNYPLRVGVLLVLFILGLVILASLRKLEVKDEGINIAEVFQMVDAAVNELLLMGAGIFSLITLEHRRKRGRVIRAVNKLRCLAHIVDAHQLQKDPDLVNPSATATPHSPKRDLSPFELGRYLDYCSELLSLISKQAFLYVQSYDDPAANEAVYDLENLANGISTKIWQKIMILRFHP